MQLLPGAITPETAPDECAARVLHTVPVVMQFIRRHMRNARAGELNIPQLRTLWFVNQHHKASLSDAAEWIGLSLPAMSRLVDCLVRKELVNRTSCPNDRRHIRLAITPAGKSALEHSTKATHERLAAEMASLSPEQRGAISSVMDVLLGIFEPGEPRHEAH